MAGFTFVGRERLIARFGEFLARPRGELLVVTGAEGSGKSHLLRRLRREADAAGRHFVGLNDVGFLPDADLRLYSIVASLAVGQEGAGEEGGLALPQLREFLQTLMTEDRREPQEKLLRVFSAAAARLGEDARLVLLADLGPAEPEAGFPLDFLARRLPERAKLVVAGREVSAAVASLDNATVVSELPSLGEGDVGKLLEFHLPSGAVDGALTMAAVRRFGGQPMLTDLAAKLVVEAEGRAEALRALPPDAGELCRALIEGLDDSQRALALCLARVPSGVDIESLRSLTDFSDADLRRLLRSDAIRNIVITQRTPRGPRAHLFHRLFVEQLLADVPEDSEEARAFHKRAAAFFLGVVERDPLNVDALSAHAYHLRLSGDKRQFLKDFPRTYKVKHSLRLFARLADEYNRLIQYTDELGEAAIHRSACLANLGRVHEELGQNDDALRCYRQALEGYQHNDDTAGTAEQYANIASALQAKGRLQEAHEHLQKAIGLDRQTDNKGALAADLNNLGILCQQLDRHDEALHHHQQALELHQEVGNDVGVANQLANIAAIHRTRGDLEAARDAYQRAWQIDNRTQSRIAEIADLRNLGLVFQDLDDMEKAITCFQQAIELDRAVADREGEASHLRTLAAMHARLGNSDQAIPLLQQATEIDRSIGNPQGEAEGLLGLANAHRLQGALGEARAALERAGELAASCGNEEVGAAVGEALGKVERQERGESVEEEQEAPPQKEAAQQQHFQREAADADLWANLQLVDEEQAAAQPAAEARAAPSDSDDVESLRRERDAALRRVAQLEAELQEVKKVLDSLRKIMGAGDEPS
ncbi:MAG: tetratricopeptide repeat protein [Candidatus Brocadiia bacterium]